MGEETIEKAMVNFYAKLFDSMVRASFQNSRVAASFWQLAPAERERYYLESQQGTREISKRFVGELRTRGLLDREPTQVELESCFRAAFRRRNTVRQVPKPRREPRGKAVLCLPGELHPEPGATVVSTTGLGGARHARARFAEDCGGPEAVLVDLMALLVELESAIQSEGTWHMLDIEVHLPRAYAPAFRQMGDDLTSLLSFALGVQASVIWKDAPAEYPHNDTQMRADQVTLFSGGLDSTAGSLVASSHASTALCSVQRGPVTSVQRRVFERIPELQGSPWIRVRQVGGGKGLHQLRGALFITAGLVACKMVRGQTLVIPECGVTMYQPRLTPLDTVTVTTHPRLVDLAVSLANKITQHPVRVWKPFENMTKAETLACIPRTDDVRFTHSCFNTRYAHLATANHCGVCYACVLRRIGATVAGAESADTGLYAKDIVHHDFGAQSAGPMFGGGVFGPEDVENLVLVVDLARLTIRDKLPPEVQFALAEYGKEDLFRRFSLEVLAALRAWNTPNVASLFLSRLWSEVSAEVLVSESELDERVAAVQSHSFVPTPAP